MPDEEDSPVIPKTEHSREASLSSIESSPEPEVDGQTSLPQDVQVQKRKGGRKPIYATSEERKQRNRQAQAAFRERRTEYIKQLESTIKQQDETLQNLQQNHRSAADECLMLRYKNSLLERILLEKGIDVQAELKTKEVLLPGKATAPLTVQRTVVNRQHHLNRLSSTNAPQIRHSSKGSVSSLATQSPKLQSTPLSHTSSPSTARSPSFAMAGGLNSPQAAFQVQAHLPHQSIQSLKNVSFPGTAVPTSNIGVQSIMSGAHLREARNSSTASRPTHWPSPYQTHITQLEEEYDTHADMIEDQEGDDQNVGPGPYPQSFQQHDFTINQTQMAMQQQDPMQATDPNPSGFGSMNLFDPFDPMLDADPFGLTASMHFPTQFTFQESAMRK